MNAVVLGGADCLWRDLQAFEALGIEAKAVAVNESGIAYRGHLDVWATLHPSKFADWAARRYGRKDYIAYGRMAGEGIDKVLADRWPGSSGLYGVQIALDELHADRVFLCGVPMTPTPHFHSDQAWQDCPNYLKGWKRAESELQGRVKSFSGWTREFLGHPSDWHDA